MFQFLLKKKDIYIIDNFKFCKINSYSQAILLGINEKNFSKYQKDIILSAKDENIIDKFMLSLEFLRFEIILK